MDTAPLDAFVEQVADPGCGRLLVVTGAGVSRASGIPTFRGDDPDAVWHRSVTELGTLRRFREDPVAVWRHYAGRLSAVLAAQPNPAHYALADLQRWQHARGGEALVVSQNVDLLHERAGTRGLIKAHGAADRTRCSRDGCTLGAPAGSRALSPGELEAFLVRPSLETIPRCTACGELVRPHVLWFDETYQSHGDYGIERIEDWAARFDLCLFVGTSFSVGLTELVLVQALLRERAMVTIDPGQGPPLERFRTIRSWPELEERQAPPAHSLHLRAPAEVVLPALCAALGATSSC